MPYSISKETINCPREMISWMRENYFFFDPWGLAEACTCRDVGFLEWLIDNGYEINPCNDFLSSALNNAKLNKDPFVREWVIALKIKTYG